MSCFCWRLESGVKDVEVEEEGDGRLAREEVGWYLEWCMRREVEEREVMTLPEGRCISESTDVGKLE